MVLVGVLFFAVVLQDRLFVFLMDLTQLRDERLAEQAADAQEKGTPKGTSSTHLEWLWQSFRFRFEQHCSLVATYLLASLPRFATCYPVFAYIIIYTCQLATTTATTTISSMTTKNHYNSYCLYICYYYSAPPCTYVNLPLVYP